MIWNKIEKYLKTQGIKTDTLTPHLLVGNKLIPHLFSQLNSNDVANAIAYAGIEVVDLNSVDESRIAFKDLTFGIAIIKGIDSDIYKLFLVNPLDDFLIFQATKKANTLNLKFDNDFGLIYPNIFRNENNDEKIDNLLDVILIKATKFRVSDIHIVVRNSNNISIMFRQFGELLESNISDISFDNYQQFANILISKGGGNGGVYTSYLEQQFNYKDNGLDLAVRVQQNPTIHRFQDGKTVPNFILRLHNSQASSSFKSIESIGFLPEQTQLLKSVSKHNSGLIIVAGPTGSGKTTALYSILSEAISGRKRSVQTIEDPVEIVIPGINQTNINQEAGITYENAINKSILRSDTDIALIGEIRSSETAKGVIELDRVGHLVLATIHAKTSIAVIDRLREFGVKNSHISDSLSCILSTRLVKQVCKKCSTIKESRELGIASKYQEAIGQLDRLAVVNNKGCNACEAGYSGRVLVAEVIKIDNKMREIINSGDNLHNLELHSKNHRNKTIWDHGLELVKQGITTIEELELVLPNFENFGRNSSGDEYIRV